MDAVEELHAQGIALTHACSALSQNRATFYRHRRTTPEPESSPPPPRPRPARALTDEQRQAVLDALYSEEFMDKSCAEVWAILLDRDIYLCSLRTMYRILASEKATRERRAQRKHTAHKAPELVATAPNQVWSWDITKLKSAQRGQWFHLYVILDIYSRYIVGWLISGCESAELAKHLITQSARKQNIDADQLTLHSDRGAAMTSKKVCELLDDLKITKSFSRPRVSNDNAYSESQFKTLKYHPTFPSSFQDLEDARGYIQSLITWYNHEHFHEGIALLTPVTVHHGQADTIITRRQQVLKKAHEQYPERFVKGAPRAPELPEEVRIGRPATTLTQGIMLP